MWTISLLYNCMVRSPLLCVSPLAHRNFGGGRCCGMTFRVFLFRSIPVFFQFNSVVFRESWLHATPTHLPCAHAARQTPRNSLSRTKLSYAHVRSTGSCVNARVFSCDYSFYKRVNKTFFGVKIRFRVFFYSRSTICCCGR